VQERIYPDLEEMSRAAASDTARVIGRAAQTQGLVSLVLSGGTTPGRTHEMLSGYDLPWERVHLFFSDERMVDRGDPLSNYGLAHRTLLSRISVPGGNVHPFPTGISPDEAARSYEEEIQEFFARQGGKGAGFDLVLLGMGRDGHTASLFPGRPSLGERHRLVLHEPDPGQDPFVERLTMTLGALNRSREVFFLLSGTEKIRLYERISENPEAAALTLPAAMVRPKGGRITWFVSQR
jgi:6-phosphogluconolactonase